MGGASCGLRREEADSGAFREETKVRREAAEGNSPGRVR